MAEQPARAFAHVGVTVPDIDAAIAWYRDVLGLTLVLGPVDLVADGDVENDGVAAVFGARFRHARQAHMATGNGVGFELFEFVDPPTRAPEDNFDYTLRGFSHVCFVAPDIDELAARIEATGGRARTRSFPVFAGQPYRFRYCEDPFGNVVELHSNSYEQIFANQATAPAAASEDAGA
jgi:catechol 2,3-dioxygenase-like lactoylglutathione lyase family enzyme